MPRFMRRVCSDGRPVSGWARHWFISERLRSERRCKSNFGYTTSFISRGHSRPIAFTKVIKAIRVAHKKHRTIIKGLVKVATTNTVAIPVTVITAVVKRYSISLTVVISFAPASTAVLHGKGTAGTLPITDLAIRYNWSVLLVESFKMDRAPSIARLKVRGLCL